MKIGQDNNMAYCWQGYERILLAIASILVWFPVIWAFFLPEFMEFLDWIMSWVANREGDSFRDFIFLSYVILGLMVYSLIFGLLAYKFPNIYILPAWGLMLYSFYLSAQKAIFYLVNINDLDKFYYFENGENRYHFYTSTDILLLILALFFLAILIRPAHSHMRFIWHKIRE